MEVLLFPFAYSLLPAFSHTYSEGLSQLTTFQLLAARGPQEKEANMPEIIRLAKTEGRG
jgi:hypothetical protein